MRTFLLVGIFAAIDVFRGLYRQSTALTENLVKLRERGVCIIGPKTGHVACGSDGSGRMVELEEIFKAISGFEG